MAEDRQKAKVSQSSIRQARCGHRNPVFMKKYLNSATLNLNVKIIYPIVKLF